MFVHVSFQFQHICKCDGEKLVMWLQILQSAKGLFDGDLPCSLYESVICSKFSSMNEQSRSVKWNINEKHKSMKWGIQRQEELEIDNPP